MSADGGPEDAAARDTDTDTDAGSDAESAVRETASANGGSAVRRARAAKGESVVREAGSVNGEAGSGKAGAVNGVASVREADGAEGEPGALDAVSAPDAEGKPRRTTRRFPLFTRDTARPEGGGRAAGGDAPAPARQWPILAVLSAVGLGLLLTALDVFRLGTILIGAALLAGAVMRWMLPDVGMLAVRSRFTDMLTYGVLGVAIVLLSLMAQPNPWLVIPFLDDTLHFTVR
ncbi:membrane protein [Streptomyces olivochromogenes]|uniref:Membrane protein n=1 Tax=Streptomyces olivochromogenes TaxID=1963 RepID=A0A250VNF7_STROL|nr:membrane protein [Streptomyces olivochromogenes]